ncbi:MAG: methylated-DNA--[protein]-cysteine S-methyltransferase [Acidimicrobiia bacterium]
MADLRWWIQATPIGAITVSVGDAGVRSIQPGVVPVADGLEEIDREVASELQEYFAGTRRLFSVPVDLSSVAGPVARIILDTLAATVPFGSTVGYGELAQRAGRPGAARAVGQAMAHNPVPLIVPCHRVVAASGALGGFGWGAEIKRWLLRHEGIQLL